MSNEPLLTNKEAAAYLKVDPRTLAKWRWRRYPIPYYKFAGRVYYKQSDLDNFVDQHLHPMDNVERRKV